MTSNMFARSLRRAPVTTVVLVLIALVYAAEVLLGGANNAAVLVYLGALHPQLVFGEGEWWRVVTAAFLHGGLMHLVLNGFALFQLGTLFEVWMGSWRLVGVYFCSAVSGSVASLFWTRGLSVGASGAVFGLLGALIAILAKRRERLRPEAARLMTQLMVWAGLNIFFGLTMERIDNAGHFGGFVAGAVIGLLLTTRTERRVSGAA